MKTRRSLNRLIPNSSRNTEESTRAQPPNFSIQQTPGLTGGRCFIQAPSFHTRILSKNSVHVNEEVR